MRDKQLAALEKLISLQEESNRTLRSIEKLLERQGRQEIETRPESHEEMDEKLYSLMTKNGPIELGGND